jgi:GAF domain-containing protein
MARDVGGSAHEADGGRGDVGDPRRVERRLNQLLGLILEVAAEALRFDGATTTARHEGDVGTVGTTGQRWVALDDAQYASGEGPCLTALESGETVVWNAGDGELAWRAFQEAAAELGIATSLSVPLPIDDTVEIAASLNLYAQQRDEVTERELVVATQFAVQLAAALQMIDATKSTAQIARETARAMRSRAAIEQARGVLIAQRGVTPDQAFLLLVDMAEADETTVHAAAATVIGEATAAGAA